MTSTVLDRLTQIPTPVRRLLPFVAVAAIAGIIATRGLGVGLMALAGIALLAAIFLAWNSVQSLTGEAELSLDEALGMAVPSVEEERKRAILRALKDLEYERSVGKVSDADYLELSTQYRAEAKELLRALEQQDKPARARAERLLQKKLLKAGLSPDAAQHDDEEEASASESPEDSKPKDEPSDSKGPHDEDESDEDDAGPDSGREDDDDAPSSEPVEATDTPSPEPPKVKVGPSRACSECASRNDLDAAFCKKCGHPLADEDQRLCQACPAVYAEEEESCPQCGVPFED